MGEPQRVRSEADRPGWWEFLASLERQIARLQDVIDQRPDGDFIDKEGREELRRLSAIQSGILEDLVEWNQRAVELAGEAPSEEDPRGLVAESSQTTEAELLELLAAEWARAGAEVFLGPVVPSRAQLLDAAARVLLAAMARSGLTITQAAARCRTSRASIRKSMQRAGVYNQHVAARRKGVRHG